MQLLAYCLSPRMRGNPVFELPMTTTFGLAHLLGFLPAAQLFLNRVGDNGAERATGQEDDHSQHRQHARPMPTPRQIVDRVETGAHPVPHYECLMIRPRMSAARWPASAVVDTRAGHDLV